jgi:thioredoxin reductase (NADPH)
MNMTPKTKKFIVLLFVAIGAITGLALLIVKQIRDEYKVDKIEQIDNIIPVAVLGSGPAGLSAAMCTARAKYKTVIFAGETPRGQLNQARSVENWPAKDKAPGSSLMSELEEQAKNFGAELIQDTITNVNFTCWPFELEGSNGKQYRALAVIIATGLAPKKPTIPGANKYWGHGVGSCAICESSFNKSEDAIVIGNGKGAAELVLHVVASAHHVTVIIKEPEFNASEKLLEQIKACKNVTIKTNTEAIRINGNRSTVSSVTVKDLKTGQQSNIPSKLVLCSLGFTPMTDLFKNYLSLDSHGYIKIKGRTQKTSRKGIFAAGTVEDRQYGKANISAAAGTKAGLDAIAFLESIGFNAYKAQAMSNLLYHNQPQEEIKIPVVTSSEAFEKTLKEAQGPVVADFFMPSCPACIQLMPHFEAVARRYQHEKDFVKVDVSHDKTLITNLSITKVPQVIIFNQGAEKKRCEPAKDEKDLKACITKAGN